VYVGGPRGLTSVIEQGEKSALEVAYFNTYYGDSTYWGAFSEKLLDAGASAENEVKG
jgi:hypothetical protein